MQNKPLKKRKRWWQKLEHWIFITPNDSGLFFTLSVLMVYWWRGLPIWVLFFPSLYLIYGVIFHYKNSTPFWLGRKKIEKATHPALYFTCYFVGMLVILWLIFFDVAKLISNIF
jgi:hypothetical protein